MKYRRFGKTELEIPVVSCGGMRYQESWQDVEETSDESQKNVEACIHRALELGINHIETARGYGCSEYQLGKVLPTLPRDEIIVQTKVGAREDVAEFAAMFERSMSLLKLDHVDLFAFHGINSAPELELAKKCFDQAAAWKKEGRIRHIGFSTHGSCADITKAIETDLFEYVNLHYFWIYQENWPAVQAANARDMGVFIISPNEKGGMLFNPTEQFSKCCAPLHPLSFNGLFCLSHPEVHTLSCGIAKPEEFDPQIVMADLLESPEQAAALVAPIIERLEGHMEETLGQEWALTWRDGLPEWQDTPGEINIPMILRLRNLAVAFGMVEYGKMRYNLLGNGGSWFPGQQAADLSKHDLTACLAQSPNARQIPAVLAEAHELLKGEEKKRLQEE